MRIHYRTFDGGVGLKDLLHLFTIQGDTKTMTDDEIYQRQQELDLNPPKTITVIGVGGVGSWVALDLALAGVEKIYMVDHDHIETHNLNRTPFKESQVDQDKVTALTELVSERRIDAEPVPITDRIENLAEHSGRK